MRSAGLHSLSLIVAAFHLSPIGRGRAKVSRVTYHPEHHAGDELARRAPMRTVAPVVVVALVLVARLAAADPVSLTGAYSSYETQAIEDAESALHTRVDASPEGKLIERIELVRLDPIDPHDPLPRAVNLLHTTSRTRVLRHELTVTEGQPYEKVAVDESARNLRALPQLSLVVCIPMRGSREDTVRLVVITKDVWSLYVDFDIAATSGGLELLTLEPKETNIGGLQHTAMGRVLLRPLSLTLGASYEIPRLDGRWLDLVVDGNVIVNRASGAVEGSFGTLSVQRPLYSSHTEWAWSSAITWTDQVTRRYVNASVGTFTPTGGLTPVPWVYRERTIAQTGKLTRSFGWKTKNDLSLGAIASLARYQVPSDPALDPAAIDQFQRAAVPTGQNRVGPFVQWHGYTSNFLRTFDFDTLSLEEDQRLGQDLWLRVYPLLRALGSSRDLVGTYAGAAYGVPLGNGVARASIESTVEAGTSEIFDASLKASAGIVTPRFAVGRLVFTATALNRWRNSLNTQAFLGGESMLRGYPSRYLTGKDLFATNLEFRSRSFDVASVLFGFVAFYDVGDAFNGFDHLAPKHSVGGGLRLVFPQLERSVLRFDLAFPVHAGPLPPDVPPVSFFVAFNQALSLPTVGGLSP